jgi:nicotinate-nucleotide adenylyltransferase
MKKERILVGGSCANPPHLGHKQVLELVLKRYEYDRVIWIPSGFRLDKEEDYYIHPDHRVAMTELLINQSWRFGWDTIPLIIKYDEIYNKSMTTYDRFIQLQIEYPNAEITWFTGSDSNIREWYKGDELVEKFNFLIINRLYWNNYRYKKYKNIADANNEPFYNYSSSEIRNLISKNNDTYRNYITPEVYQYIEKYKLYRIQKKK